MRRIGNLLLVLGVVAGVGTAIGYSLNGGRTGWAWVLGIGLMKVGLLIALGLIGAGGVAMRLANRADTKKLLDAHLADITGTGDRQARDDARLRR